MNIFHEQLNISTPCEYTSGWYGRFKKRNGLRNLTVCGEKASADYDAAEEYLEEFYKLVTEQHLSQEQACNADETALYWRYLSQKTVVTPQESAPSGFKDSKERLTVLACSNASGTQNKIACCW